MAEEELMTVHEVAKRLRVDESTVRRWIKSGILEAVGYQVKRSEFERLLDNSHEGKPRQNSEQVSPTVQAESKQPYYSASVRFTETLEWLAGLKTCEDWLILDLESTGFHMTAEVIELVIADHRGHILMNTEVNPLGEIHPMAQIVHGLSSHRLRSAPSFADIYGEVMQLITGKEIISYSVAFDIRMLSQTAALHNLGFPPYIRSTCLMHTYARYYRGKHLGVRYRTFSLGKACEQINITNTAFHRAQIDTMAAYRLLLAMMENANDPNAICFCNICATIEQ